MTDISYERIGDTTMANKMTNVQALSLAIATLSENGFDAEALEKLGNIKASYERKGRSEKKPTPVQLENERIKARIVELLSDGVQRTISEICKALDGDYSVSKITSLCTALYAKGSGSISRTEIKRKPYYFIEA